jgi:hypothetical protein
MIIEQKTEPRLIGFVPLQFFKFTDLSLQFTYLEICHYNSFFDGDVPFYTYLMLLGPLADLRIFLWSKMHMLSLFSPLADLWAPRHLLPPFLLSSNQPVLTTPPWPQASPRPYTPPQWPMPSTCPCHSFLPSPRTPIKGQLERLRARQARPPATIVAAKPYARR